MTYAELQKALEVFGLPEQATLRQIKKRHRELVKKYHPDTGDGHDPARIRVINAASRILLDYCEQYVFSFSENEFYRQSPEERLRIQFCDVPLWGSK